MAPTAQAQMDLSALDAAKGRALEAQLEGDFREAERIYEGLEPHYERHRAEDALLSLAFNRMLGALERGDRRNVRRRMDVLGQRLQAAKPTPAALEIGRRVRRLFDQPIPGVAHEASAALVLLADRVGPPGPITNPGAPEPLPPLSDLAALDAPDVALVILRAAAALPEDSPPWLRSVAIAFGPAHVLPVPVIHALERWRSAWAAEDLLHAYPALVDALEGASAADPAATAELSQAAAWLESRGLPERLSYTPGLPEERRLRASLTLHGRLALALSGHRGAQALARGQWQHTAALAEDSLQRSRARGRRGSARGEDLAAEAAASVWLARAACAAGDLRRAEAALAGAVDVARREAYDELAIAALVFREAAIVAEARGSAEAVALYSAAIEATLPGLREAGTLPDQVERTQQVVAEGRAEEVALAAECLAALARRSESAEILKLARVLLDVARPALDPNLAARSVLIVSLSAAILGEAGAASQALEAARALERPGAVALALALEGLQARNAGKPGASTVVRAAEEAAWAATGQIRRAVELAAAAMALEGAKSAVGLETRLRSAADAVESCTGWIGELDVFLRAPCALAKPQLELAGVLETLRARGDAPLCRRLSTAARRSGLRSVGVVGPHARRIARLHAERFLEQGVRAPGADLEALWASISRPATAWRGAALEPGEARVELLALESWSLAVVDGPSGISTHRYEVGAQAWRRRIGAWLDRLRAGDEAGSHSLAAELHALLIQPLEASLTGVTRLTFAPDAHFLKTPFALLHDERAWLASRYEIAVARSAPPPRVGEGPAPAKAVFVGDSASPVELDTVRLTRKGAYTEVRGHRGRDIAGARLADTLAGVRVVHLVGALERGAALHLLEGAPATSLDTIGRALGAGGAVCASLANPLDAQGEAAARLLPGCRGGLLARRWAAVDPGNGQLHAFLGAVASAKDEASLCAAVAGARRKAIAARVPAVLWGAYGFFVGE